MNSLNLIAAVREALLDTEAGAGVPVFTAGAVPAKQPLPYLVLSLLPSTSARIAVDTDRSIDGVQIDAYAPSLVDAAGLADTATGIVLGLGAVAVAEGPAASFGLRKADGSWRTVFPTEVATTGERVVRVASLFTQVELTNS